MNPFNFVKRVYAAWGKTGLLSLSLKNRFKVFTFFVLGFLAHMMKNKIKFLPNSFYSKYLSFPLKLPIHIGDCNFFIESKNAYNAFVFLGEEMGQLFNNFEISSKRKAVVFDLGAEIGVFSIFASKMTRGTAKIYAFEPEKNNIAELQRNISINNCKNIRIIPKAVSDRSALATFYLDNPLSHSLYKTGKKCIRIKTTSIDAFSKDNNITRIDFLKVNIEGAELKALEGASSMLNKTDRILIGIHNFINPSLEENVCALLKRNGFISRRLPTAYKEHPWYLFTKRDSEKGA